MAATTPASDALTPEEAAAARTRAIEEHVDKFLTESKHSADRVVELGRFLLFILYAILGALSFWFWIVAAAIGLLRLLLTAVMTPLLWLADGPPRGPGGRRRPVVEAVIVETEWRWRRRELFYAELARPLARGVLEIKRSGARFWHLTLARKAVVAIMGFFFVFVPGMYVVPRAHYVQVTDDNAINHRTNGAVEYLVHARDMDNPGKTREYRNENMWYFGKINAQGMKAEIQPGRYYKMWVVGIRWYIPQSYPNIISVQELDANGRPIDRSVTKPTAQ